MVHNVAAFFRQICRPLCLDYTMTRSLNTDISFINIQNRNPRNLERMRIARKPTGYHLDNPGREYWHRLLVVQKLRYIVASVEHNNGNTVITASSNEWPIRKYLYKANDAIAYVYLARVLAHRCLESGINHMVCDPSLKNTSSEKLKSFISHFEEEGVMLFEPPVYVPATPWSKEVEQKPWTVHAE